MKKVFIHISMFLLGLASISCVSLDVPPVNILTGEDIFTNESGIKAYLADIYYELPIEDFRYSSSKGFNVARVTGANSGLTGEAICRDQSSQCDVAWWTEGYHLLRKINTLINAIEENKDSYSEDQYRQWLGEAYFCRAFTYFSMVKRHGGVILVNDVLEYPNESGDITEYMLPRNSEEECWDQISSDFDNAISLLGEGSGRSRANKYVAAAYKARAMIFAASIANFNTVSHFDTERQIRLCGIPKERAADYYTQAYEAAKLCEGKYSLYMDEWKEGDKQAQYQNFHNVLQKSDNCESIYVKEFAYPINGHSWDNLYGPLQLMVGSLAGGVNPTADFVEMFDGLRKDAAGHLDFLDSKGNYILYDTPMDPYKDAEPRLRATVIFPSDIYKGESIEIWRGIYTAKVGNGIPKMIKATSTTKYHSDSNVKKLCTFSSKMDNTTYVTLPDGTKMAAGGRSGSWNSAGYGTYTGFLLRKNMDESLPADLVVAEHSESDWVDMRYAEVMLTRAEAAFELTELGAGNYIADAYDLVQQIRRRAGADLLASEGELTRDVIRKEIRKELAFENKAYWNLVRWRIYDQEQASKRRYYCAMPFYVAENGKWFFDYKYNEASKTYTFKPSWYYIEIPSSEIDKNTNIIKNPS